MKRRLRKTRVPRIGSRGPARSDRGGCVSRGGRQAERRGNAPKRFRQALQRFLHDGRRCRQPCCVSLFERDRLDRYRTGVRFATSDTGRPERMTWRRAAPSKSVKARSTGPLCRKLALCYSTCLAAFLVQNSTADPVGVRVDTETARSKPTDSSTKGASSSPMEALKMTSWSDDDALRRSPVEPELIAAATARETFGAKGTASGPRVDDGSVRRRPIDHRRCGRLRTDGSRPEHHSAPYVAPTEPDLALQTRDDAVADSAQLLISALFRLSAHAQGRPA